MRDVTQATLLCKKPLLLCQASQRLLSTPRVPTAERGSFCLPGHWSPEWHKGHLVWSRSGTSKQERDLYPVLPFSPWNFSSVSESALEFDRLNHDAMSRSCCRCRHDPF